MSNSNRETVGFIKEVTPGTNPGGTKQLLNFTSYNVGSTNMSTVSNFVRSDTNRAGTIRTGKDVSGDMGIELQGSAYNLLLAGVMRNTFGTAFVITASTVVSAASADNSFNGTALFANVVQGSVIKTSGFTNPANNGYFVVTTVSSTSKIIVSGGTLTTETAGAAVTMKGTGLKNGIIDSSFTFERAFLDMATFHTQTGIKVNEFNLKMGTSEISTGSFALVGINEIASGTSGFSGSTAANTNPSMNTVDHVRKVILNGAAYLGDLINFEVSIKTNAEARKAIGSLTALEVLQRSIGVSGSLGEYMEDNILINYKNNFTDTSMAIVMEDANGNGFGLFLPKINFTEAKVDNGGIDQDINTALSYTATYDPTYLATAVISYW